jgi:putative peptidoglycan lipid II flippase
VIGGAVIGVTYLGLAMVLRIGEITEVVGMVRRRLGR